MSQGQMSQWQVIDIMTYNSYSFTVLQFLKRKNRFREDCSCFLDNANSHQALQYNNITVSKNDFLRYSLTVDSFWKRIFCVTILTAYSITEEVSIISWLSVLYALNGRKWPYGFWLDTKRWIFNVLNFRSYQESRNKGWEGRF